jgi:hypothetical protein
VQAAAPRGAAAALRLVHNDGTAVEIEADHVIAATGYHVVLGRLQILDPALRSALRTDDQSPALSANFESSKPGLYFIGVASANCFGPLMRFARGAEYAACRLGNHLASIYDKLEPDRSARQAKV